MKAIDQRVARYADMFAALGAEPRLRIVRLSLVAYPRGMRAPRYADMFSALGAEPRLRIVRLLLSDHPDGMVVNEIQAETGVAGSTLSHHLQELDNDTLRR